MTSLLKYKAMCDMQNEVKVHLPLHDIVWTLIKYVVIDRHDIPITCHCHPQFLHENTNINTNTLALTTIRCAHKFVEYINDLFQTHQQRRLDWK